MYDIDRVAAETLSAWIQKLDSSLGQTELTLPPRTESQAKSLGNYLNPNRFRVQLRKL